MTDEEIKKKAVKATRFDTFFYDDTIKIDVFQKNSFLKSYAIGKGIIELKEMAHEPKRHTIISLPIMKKKA